MSAIKRLSRIAAGHGDKNIRHLQMPVAGTCRHIAVNDRWNRLWNKICPATAILELPQFALNACRLKAAGNIVTNDTELVAIFDVDFLVQRHGFRFRLGETEHFRIVGGIADECGYLPACHLVLHALRFGEPLFVHDDCQLSVLTTRVKHRAAVKWLGIFEADGFVMRRSP